MGKNKKKDQKSTYLFNVNNIFTDKFCFILGIILFAISSILIISFLSYFSTASDDQSLVMALQSGDVANDNLEFRNICGSIGGILSYFFVSQCFGIFTFAIPLFLILCGVKLVRAYKNLNIGKWFLGLMFLMIWGSIVAAGFLSPQFQNLTFNLGGEHGAFMSQYLQKIIGYPGLIVVLIISMIIFLCFVTNETIIFIRKMLNPIGYIRSKVKFEVVEPTEVKEEAVEELSNDDFIETDTIEEYITESNSQEIELEPTYIQQEDDVEKEDNPDDIPIDIEIGKNEEAATGETVRKYDLNTPIDPREPFVKWKYPTLSLLEQDKVEATTINVGKEELEENKNKIIKVLNDFKVQIKSIRATVGPTITLYEITPAQGIKISKIKGLEDDIALNLSAIGIRIIAPMPGKGTIGIEVANANPSMVSMYSILNSKKFQESNMDLPIALGKTITNEVFMADLAKIPHLLVAGATGQGKSVGLNVILTSLLYKKHPNELKIVLIDPKKVEFSIYGPIAKPYMAAVEENENEPIITDIAKVVKTLKGLCTLMDERYDLLKAARVRNIKEYNMKFLKHQLNPQDGHEFMPYIVVVIDEFGDLILSQGKEVEMPITRLAQLARAIGIHMIIATQRPTTTIITGNIKANFPGRIAFRVGAMIDSRVILDRLGADKLIGRGDMLYLNGGEPVRVQCAFLDTPEVENISNFIANQPGPVTPLEIPEPLTENNESAKTSIDVQNLDPIFKEVARTIVINQNGSTSMIQRKFSIGYSRAGRLMDEMEKVGIVGPQQGSKPREVLIQDEASLETLLVSLK